MPALNPTEQQRRHKNQMDFISAYATSPAASSDELIRRRRIATLQKKQKVSVIADPRVISAKDSLLDTTGIDKFPTNTHLNMKLAPNWRGAKKSRHLSRYRIIHGPVDFYSGTDFKQKDRTQLYVMSTNGINLMGSSPTDLSDFVSSRGKLNVAAFKSEYEKIADHIVATAKSEGKKLVMPTFGAGVYLKNLSKDQQTIAKKIIFESFANAASKHQTHVYWDAYSNREKGIYDAIPNIDRSFISVETGDMVELAKNLQQRGENIALLNAGSDRTIGGGYTAAPHPGTPTEEQTSHQSDLVFMHSRTFNEPILKSELDKAVRLSAKQLPTTSPTQISAQKGTRRELTQVLVDFKRAHPNLNTETKATVTGHKYQAIKGLEIIGKDPNAKIVLNKKATPYLQTLWSKWYNHPSNAATAAHQVNPHSPSPARHHSPASRRAVSRPGTHQELGKILAAFKHTHPQLNTETKTTATGHKYQAIKGLEIKGNGPNAQIVLNKDATPYLETQWSKWYNRPSNAITASPSFNPHSPSPARQHSSGFNTTMSRPSTHQELGKILAAFKHAHPHLNTETKATATGRKYQAVKGLEIVGHSPNAKIVFNKDATPYLKKQWNNWQRHHANSVSPNSQSPQPANQYSHRGGDSSQRFLQFKARYRDTNPNDVTTGNTFTYSN
jgi:hypothetical protein